MFKRIATIVIFVLLAVVTFMLIWVIQPKEDVKVVYVTVTPEPTATMEAQPTPTPIYVIQVTPEPSEEPTKRPNVILITRKPTNKGTCEPTVEPTNIPTEVPTNVPTLEPSKEPTIAPTEQPTVVPTIEPTEEPTVVPTVEPTVEPTEKPMEDPTNEPTVDLSNYYSKVEKEMATVATPRGGLYYDYETAPQYDLYDYIELDNLDSVKLFNLLRKPFENGISNWADMEFTSEADSMKRLNFALESSVCDLCGRVRMKGEADYNNQISMIFDEIVQNGCCAEANQMLLDYLYRYTIKMDNSYERLFVVCSD